MEASRTRQLLIALLGLAGLLAASAASAVRLGMSTDASVYQVGDSIVVTLLGETTGAPAWYAVDVEVGYDDPLVIEPLSASQTPITSTSRPAKALAPSPSPDSTATPSLIS